MSLFPVFLALLTVACPGDINGDLKVDLTDLGIVQANYGQPGGPEDGDLNGDGIVDGEDMSIVLAYYGKDCAKINVRVPVDVEFRNVATSQPVSYNVKIEHNKTFDDYAVMLSTLEPLQKIHYSWPLPQNLINHHDLMSEYVRITGAASISARWGDHATILAQLKPFLDQYQAKLGLNYSPLHYEVPEEGELLDLLDEVDADYQLYESKMTNIKTLVDSLGLTVGCVLLDSERFWVKEGNDLHNDTLDATYNRYYDLSKSLFPGATVVWYARGAVHSCSSDSGWCEIGLFTLRERGDNFSCSLYHSGNHRENQEIMRRTVEHAADYGSPKVIPWVSLGSGYVPDVNVAWKFDMNWNYDLIYAWKMGAEINHPWFGDPVRWGRYAPWNQADMALFYPEPFGRTKKWGTYFVAYVRGSHLVRELP